MRSLLSAAAAALIVASHQKTCEAFTSSSIGKARHATSLDMSIKQDDDRRSFLSKVAVAATGLTFLPTQSALAAFGNSLKKVNDQLAGYGLPQMAKAPSGFSPLLELYGKGRNRTPYLVQFLYPSDWVVQLPNIDVNGEEGTVQAGQYSAGDTATFYLLKDEKVEDITTQTKDFYQTAVIKAISQKGNNVYQNFKVIKTEPGTVGEYKDQKYMIVDFKYDLLTGAGFEVERRGVASITNTGDTVQVLWSASTRTRFKKTETQLRTIVSSFRCYSDGLSLAKQSAAKDMYD